MFFNVKLNFKFGLFFFNFLFKHSFRSDKSVFVLNQSWEKNQTKNYVPTSEELHSWSMKYIPTRRITHSPTEEAPVSTSPNVSSKIHH